jgi:hypothetical protein
MSELFKKFSFDTGDFVSGDSNNDFKPGYMKVGNENKKKEADSFRSRFASNMADYFKDNPDAFDFKPGSVGDKATKFSDQFEGSFDQVADGFGIFQPRTNPMTVIPGQQGQPGLLSQIAGPVAGAAAQAFFPCDMRLKHDINCLTDMNLVKDDLADVAYFVKELQDS